MKNFEKIITRGMNSYKVVDRNKVLKYLADTDYVKIRYDEELALGISTTSTEAEVNIVLVNRNTARGLLR